MTDTQADLFSQEFDGATFLPEHDRARLYGQLERVRDLMLRHRQWWTLEGLEKACAMAGTPDTPAAISARIRDLRKVKFGQYDVQSRRVPDGNGLWEYRIVGGAGDGDPEHRACRACRRVRALHYPHSVVRDEVCYWVCAEDHQMWPCRTHQAAEQV